MFEIYVIYMYLRGIPYTPSSCHATWVKPFDDSGVYRLSPYSLPKECCKKLELAAHLTMNNNMATILGPDSYLDDEPNNILLNNRQASNKGLSRLWDVQLAKMPFQSSPCDYQSQFCFSMLYLLV